MLYWLHCFNANSTKQTQVNCCYCISYSGGGTNGNDRYCRSSNNIFSTNNTFGNWRHYYWGPASTPPAGNSNFFTKSTSRSRGHRVSSDLGTNTTWFYLCRRNNLYIQ